MPPPATHTQMNNRDLLDFVTSRLSRYRSWVYAGIASLLLTNCAQVLIPVGMKTAIDELEFGTSSRLASLVGLIIALAICQALFRTLSRLFIFFSGRRVEYDIRSQLYSHMQQLSPEYYSKLSTGQLMANLTNDLTYVRMLFGFAVLHLINTVIGFAFILPAVLSIDTTLALLTVSIFPLVFVASRPIVGKILHYARQEQQMFGDLSQFLQESIGGMRLLKTYSVTSSRISLFGDLVSEYRDIQIGESKLRVFFMQLMQSTAGFGIVMVIGYGGLQVIEGTMTLGDFVAFTAYLYFLAWPTMMTGWLIPLIQRGSSAVERIQTILNEAPEPGYNHYAGEGSQPPTIYNQLDEPPRIELRNLTFSYPDAHEQGLPPTLKNLSLTIAPAAKMLITGEIGCGKSTLLKLLGQLYRPRADEFFLDGIDVTTLNRVELRRLFSLCPQEGLIFSRSLEENILFADQLRLDLQEAAQLAALGQDASQFPKGWQTVVGEQGVTLSGGQRQRAALARALAKRAPVLLLDDPIAQLDASTATRVWQDLLNHFDKITIVLVTQRLVQPESFDQIVVLERGSIIQQGTHADLMEQPGYYRRSYQLQRILADKQSEAQA